MNRESASQSLISVDTELSAALGSTHSVERGAGLAQASRTARATSAIGVEVRRANLVGAEAGGLDRGPCLRLNLRLDLHLPLVRRRVARRYRSSRAMRRDSPRGEHLSVAEPWFGRPSRHSAAQTIVPSTLDDLRRRRHPLHRLIEF